MPVATPGPVRSDDIPFLSGQNFEATDRRSQIASWRFTIDPSVPSRLGIRVCRPKVGKSIGPPPLAILSQRQQPGHKSLSSWEARLLSLRQPGPGIAIFAWPSRRKIIFPCGSVMVASSSCNLLSPWSRAKIAYWDPYPCLGRSAHKRINITIMFAKREPDSVEALATPDYVGALGERPSTGPNYGGPTVSKCPCGTTRYACIGE